MAPRPTPPTRLSARGRALRLAVLASGCGLGEGVATTGIIVERGVRLDTNGAFYRAESAVSRDLAVLAASTHRDDGEPLTVLDAFGGCGSRSARYLERGVASSVHCNEGSAELGATIRANLGQFGAEGARWTVTHDDAHALLLRNEGTWAYDLLDLDSFGLSAKAISAAMWSAKIGGLVYVTQTDGRAHTAPARCLAAYGAWPASSAATHAAINEQAVRLLVGRAVHEGALHGLAVRPLFSLFAKHGPCYRAMLSVERAPARTPQLEGTYGFVGTCGACGQHARVAWAELAAARCPNCGATGAHLRLAGPMYTGPLHDADALGRMRARALEWGDDYAEAAALLEALGAEAEAEGPLGDAPYFYHAHAVASRAGLKGPVALRALVDALRVDGFRASRTHFNRFALKTNAPVEAQVAAARALAGVHAA